VQLRTPVLLALGLALAACATPSAEHPANAPERAPDGAGPAPEGPSAAPTAPPGSAPAVAPPAAGAPPGGGVGGAPSAPEHHGPPLPELSVKSFGLHIGGSAADAGARAEFLRALEGAAPSYLDCYRAIDVPGSVGTFGVDLTIGGTGGKPKVGKPRTKLRGEAFQACMVRALEGVTFPKTPSGRAVVVSYSVKFNLGD